MDRPICIQNAMVIDGTGSSPVLSDILLKDDCIQCLGSIAPTSDMEIIDGRGMFCTPGFIDVHTHSDISFLYCGNPSGHILQGVTSEVTGNCGYSPFPLRDDLQFIQKRRNSLSLIDTPLVEWKWHTWPQYKALLKQQGVNENLRILIGYGSIRAFVMDYDDRRPTTEEQARVEAILDEALRDGVCGLSVGLGYAPDFYADTEELIEAARVVKRHNGIFAFHVRGERLTLFQAIKEVLSIALKTGVRTEISHLKCAGKVNVGRMDEILALIEEANRSGADVTFDAYPYTAGCSYLGLVFPPKYHEGGIARLLERLSDSTLLPQILRDMEYGYPGWSTFIGEQNGENLLIISTKSGNSVGKTIAESAVSWGVTPYEAAVRLILENDGIVEMVMFQCDQHDVDLVATHPWSMFGSDSMVMDPVKAPLRTRPHPRYYGAFAHLLANYGKSGQIPIESLVHKMTAMPAERFGFIQRGKIQPGYYADLCLFRLEDIKALASYEAPCQLSVGMRHVFVNGQFVVRDGQALDTKPGRIL